MNDRNQTWHQPDHACRLNVSDRTADGQPLNHAQTPQLEARLWARNERAALHPEALRSIWASPEYQRDVERSPHFKAIAEKEK